MDRPTARMARQIAAAAHVFEQQRTGHGPQSVTVVLSDDTLVITLHGALSEAEKALAKNPEGAAQLQEFHRRLFASAGGALRRKSSASPERRCAKRPLKSSRTGARWRRCSVPARWCRCSCWPTESSAAPGERRAGPKNRRRAARAKVRGARPPAVETETNTANERGASHESAASRWGEVAGSPGAIHQA